MLEAAGGVTGILIADGHLAAQRHMHKTLAILQFAGEKLDVVVFAYGGGGAQRAAGRHVGENLLGGDIHAVPVGYAVHDDIERHGVDVKAIQQLLRQVAGAVRGDLDLHKRKILSKYAGFRAFPWRAICDVYYYGAGCSTEDQRLLITTLSRLLSSLFKRKVMASCLVFSHGAWYP